MKIIPGTTAHFVDRQTSGTGGKGAGVVTELRTVHTNTGDVNITRNNIKALRKFKS